MFKKWLSIKLAILHVILRDLEGLFSNTHSLFLDMSMNLTTTRKSNCFFHQIYSSLLQNVYSHLIWLLQSITKKSKSSSLPTISFILQLLLLMRECTHNWCSHFELLTNFEKNLCYICVYVSKKCVFYLLSIFQITISILNV